jgi:hypothetical protein
MAKLVPMKLYVVDCFNTLERRANYQIKQKVKEGKAVPLQTWSGSEIYRKLRFPDFMTTAQYGGRLSALRTGRLYPQEMFCYLFMLEGESTPGP